MNGPEQNIRRQPEPLHVCVVRRSQLLEDALYIDGRFAAEEWAFDVQDLVARIGSGPIVLEFMRVDYPSTRWPDALTDLEPLTPEEVIDLSRMAEPEDR